MLQLSTAIPLFGCLILGCLMLGCLILGCLILGCLMLGCLILGCLMLGCLMVGCLMLGCLILGCLILGVSLHFNTTLNQQRDEENAEIQIQSVSLEVIHDSNMDSFQYSIFPLNC